MFIKKLSTVRLRRNNILKWVNISTACFFCYLSKLSAHKVTVCLLIYLFTYDLNFHSNADSRLVVSSTRRQRTHHNYAHG